MYTEHQSFLVDRLDLPDFGLRLSSKLQELEGYTVKILLMGDCVLLLGERPIKLAGEPTTLLEEVSRRG